MRRLGSLLALLISALPAFADDWSAVRRVVFYDARYPNSGSVQDPFGIAGALSGRGFYIIDGDGLREWIAQWKERDAWGTVCVLAMGYMPDGAADAPTPDAAVLQYCRRGGRAVWIGTAPFSAQGVPDTVAVTWGNAAPTQALGIRLLEGEKGRPAALTDAGRAWGMTEPDNPDQPVGPDQVTLAFTVDSQGRPSAWLKNFDPAHPLSGFIRFSSSGIKKPVEKRAEDLARVATHGLELPAPGDAPAPGDLRVVRCANTPLFARVGGVLTQTVQVTVENRWKTVAAEARVVEAGGKPADLRTEIPRLHCGRFPYLVHVPVVEGETPVKVEIAVGGVSRLRPPEAGYGEARPSAEGAEAAHPDRPESGRDAPPTLAVSAVVAPAKQWLVYIDPSVHTDIGYTERQEDVIKLHNRNLEDAIAACDAVPGFAWDLENAWQAENFREAKPDLFPKLVAKIRDGKMGMEAMYLNCLTGLCSHETFNRLTLAAANLRRRHGIPVDSAIVTDIPTVVATMPSMLAGAGIRYYAMGINQERAPFWSNGGDLPQPFWWEGPDGARVLAWMSKFMYRQGNRVGLTTSYEMALQRLVPYLRIHEKGNYPYDALLLYGAFSDNQPVDDTFGRVVTQWNATWEYPKVVVSTHAEFFRHMEEKYGDRIPVLRGDCGTYWEDGAGSTAAETAMHRRNEENLVTLEKLCAIGALLSPGDEKAKYPKAAIDALWRDVWFYAEHTWGAWDSVLHPEAEGVKAQWEYKQQFATRPVKQMEELTQNAANVLAGHLDADRSCKWMLLNPLPWERKGELFYVTSTIKELERQLPPTVKCQSVDVPPCGTLRVTGSGKLATAWQSPEDVIESKYYRVRFDRATGALASIVDKDLGKELIDQSAPYRAAEVVYVVGGDDSRAVHFSPVHPVPKLQTQRMKSALLARGRHQIPEACHVPDLVDSKAWIANGEELRPASGSPLQWVAVKATVFDSVKRIDLVVSFEKPVIESKEAVYIAFPFAIDNPEFRIEVPNGVVRPETDQFKGACRDWYSVQHWVEVADVGTASQVPGPKSSVKPTLDPGPRTADSGPPGGTSGRDAPPTRASGAEAPSHPWGITLATPDVPLVCFEDIFRGEWKKKLDLKKGHVFAWPINNYWYTNYKASQGGHFEFRFSITSHNGPPDDLAATKFGWEAAVPLVTVPVGGGGGAGAEDKGNQGDGGKAETFIQCEPESVLVQAFKQAEDGAGWIVRLRDVSTLAGVGAGFRPRPADGSGPEGPSHMLARLRFPHFKFTQAVLTNLVEDPIRPLEIKDGVIEVPVPARGQATVYLK